MLVASHNCRYRPPLLAAIALFAQFLFTLLAVTLLAVTPLAVQSARACGWPSYEMDPRINDIYLMTHIAGVIAFVGIYKSGMPRLEPDQTRAKRFKIVLVRVLALLSESIFLLVGLIHGFEWTLHDEAFQFADAPASLLIFEAEPFAHFLVPISMAVIMFFFGRTNKTQLLRTLGVLFGILILYYASVYFLTGMLRSNFILVDGFSGLS